MTDDEIDPREAARIRRRDRDHSAEDRALLQPGMGKVFKQIQDAQGRAAREAEAGSPAGRRRRRVRAHPPDA